MAVQQTSLVARARSWLGETFLEQRDTDMPLSFGDWMSYFNFSGLAYPVPIFGNAPLGEKQEVPQDSFEGYIRAIYKRNGPVFAVMLVRMLVFSEARFQFRQFTNGRPGALFGTPALELLEKPWPNATTGDLLSRMIQDADLTGNSFHCLRHGNIYRMRPDWTTIVVGSRSKPDSLEPGWEIDAEVIGYIYRRGGHTGEGDIEVLLPEEVAHFAPIPDPMFRFRGLSWILPILQDVLGDAAATTHKLKFFENGATPNLVVSLDKSITDPNVFSAFVEKMEEEHAGVMNAYKTLYLAGGATTDVVGQNMRQIDFKVTQGAGETRIASAAGVPPVIAGFSEGLQSATYSNYSQARRRFADGTMRPLWRNAAGSLATLVRVPAGAQLWYDDRDIAFLRDDLKDVAEIQQAQSLAIRQLVEAGYKPDSVVAAINANDMTLLEHTGLYSVQLQSPGSRYLPDVKPGANPNESAPPEGSGAATPPTPPEPPAAPAAPRASFADVLTTRERELAELVADGLTNKEIGARAGVSERTVERVVASASVKLGAASRTQLAALVGSARVAL